MARDCPTCGYDLTGLPLRDLQCPECGIICPTEQQPQVRARQWLPWAIVPTAGAAVLNLTILTFESRESFHAEMDPSLLVQACLLLLAMVLGPPIALARAHATGRVSRSTVAGVLLGGWGLNLALLAAMYGLGELIVAVRGL